MFAMPEMLMAGVEGPLIEIPFSEPTAFHDSMRAVVVCGDVVLKLRTIVFPAACSAVSAAPAPVTISDLTTGNPAVTISGVPVAIGSSWKAFSEPETVTVTVPGALSAKVLTVPFVATPKPVPVAVPADDVADPEPLTQSV